MKALPSLEVLRHLFAYDPETGIVVWRNLPLRSKRILLGAAVGGSPDSRGYLNVKVGGISYRLHRIIWKIVTGDDPGDLIDHKNRNQIDNRWENLRPANLSQNAYNCKRSSRNKTGVKGVTFVRRDNVWRVYIGANGSPQYIGRFNEFSEAVAARRDAEMRLHGEYANPA